MIAFVPIIDLLKRNIKVNFYRQKLSQKKWHFNFGMYLFIFVQIIMKPIQRNLIERQFIRNSVRTIGKSRQRRIIKMVTLFIFSFYYNLRENYDLYFKNFRFTIFFSVYVSVHSPLPANLIITTDETLGKTPLFSLTI